MKALMALMAFLVAAAALPGAAMALDYSVESKTYLGARETTTEDDIVPVYEYVDVSVRNMGGMSVDFLTSGWFRVHLADTVGEERDTDQDLDYAYLSFRPYAGSFINLGRVLISEGVASEQLDGMYAGGRLPIGLGVSIFGGVPVETDGDERDGDVGYGGRISQRLFNRVSLGASYFAERNDDDDFREEAGVDLWASPAKGVNAEGVSSYNLLTSGWMEHSYAIKLGPFGRFRIKGDFSDVDYEHYFASTTLSAFDISSLDPEESALSLGGELEFDIGASYKAAAGYTNYDYDLSGSAGRYGARADYLYSGYAAGLSVYRMQGETDELRYNEYRAYASRRWSRVDVTLDGFDVQYDEDINDVEHAFAVAAALGFNVTKEARAVADVEYAENPYFDSELKAFFKVLLKFKGGA